MSNYQPCCKNCGETRCVGDWCPRCNSYTSIIDQADYEAAKHPPITAKTNNNMSKETIYIATVQIAFLATSEAEACDAVSEMLTGNLKYNDVIKDWQYAPFNGVYVQPLNTEITPEIFSEFEEGEVFTPRN